jgi:hypothetical protein
VCKLAFDTAVPRLTVPEKPPRLVILIEKFPIVFVGISRKLVSTAREKPGMFTFTVATRKEFPLAASITIG